MNDDGVSAVIGTIFMVVIVTLLASLTALFVYVYLQSIHPTYVVALTENRVDPATIQITNSGGTNINDLDSSFASPFIVYIDNVVTSPDLSTQLSATPGSYAYYPATVGQRIKVVGLFQGDTKQIIFDSTA